MTAEQIVPPLFHVSEGEIGRFEPRPTASYDVWHLHDAVAASSLRFSMIRMRNAAPR